MTGKWPILLYTALLCAQNDGRITGRVSDSGGLPAVHASVTLRNTFTGASEREETSGTGDYSFSGLSEGRYSLSVSEPGLESGIKPVEIGRRGVPQIVDVRLEPAHVNQEVTVVSGSRIEELQNQSSLRVEAVTWEQIRDTGYERVSDVLSEMPGVLIRSGSTATVGAEQIEGIDSRQVLVLPDGLPIIGARGIKSGIVNFGG